MRHAPLGDGMWKGVNPERQAARNEENERQIGEISDAQYAMMLEDTIGKALSSKSPVFLENVANIQALCPQYAEYDCATILLFAERLKNEKIKPN